MPNSLAIRPEQPSPFAYEGLDEAEVATIEHQADFIYQIGEQTRRTAAEGVLQIGKALSEVHSLLAGKGRDGLFKPWVKERCGFSYPTAARAIAAYETFSKSITLIPLFEPTALYLLSADSCPEDATRAALRLAKKGKPVSAKIAREIIAKHKPEEPKAPVLFAVAANQIRKSVEKVRGEMTDDGKQCLRPFLSSLASDYGDDGCRSEGSQDEPPEKRAQAIHADIVAMIKERDISNNMAIAVLEGLLEEFRSAATIDAPDDTPDWKDVFEQGADPNE